MILIVEDDTDRAAQYQQNVGRRSETRVVTRAKALAEISSNMQITEVVLAGCFQPVEKARKMLIAKKYRYY